MNNTDKYHYDKILKFLELNNKDGLETIDMGYDPDDGVESYNINGWVIDITTNNEYGEFTLIGEEGDFYSSNNLNYYEFLGALLHFKMIDSNYIRGE